MAGNRINIKNLHYAKITGDDESATTYDTPVHVLGAMQIALTPSVATGTLYGDGVIRDELAKQTGIGVQLDLNKLPVVHRAAMLGNTLKNGVLVENEADTPPEMALGFEVEQTGGKSEFVWLLKGKMAPITNTIQQTTENVNFSTDTTTMTFMPRKSDGDIKYYADTTEENMEHITAESWFEEVGIPVPTP